jgi:hypothetical protein
MKTDALIDMLATRAGAVDRTYAVRRYRLALACGAACAIVLMAATLGPRHDLAQAARLPMFWVKLAFVALLALLGTIGAFRAAIPAHHIASIVRSAVGVVVAMWAVASVALLQNPPQTRPALVLGETWSSCPWLIAGLSIPLFAAVAWAMKGMAPTRLRQAGAMAGFAAGGTAALVYSFHCPELAAPFLGTWYLLGVLIPTAIGGLLGKHLFRW